MVPLLALTQMVAIGVCETTCLATCHTAHQVELSRWMGPDAIRTLMFDKMRDAMRDDINRAMEMVEPARQPPRLTRKQQEKAATMVEQAGASGGGAGEGGGGPAPMEEDTPPPEVGMARSCGAGMARGLEEGWGESVVLTTRPQL